jgi:hypothetical protein
MLTKGRAASTAGPTDEQVTSTASAPASSADSMSIASRRVDRVLQQAFVHHVVDLYTGQQLVGQFLERRDETADGMYQGKPYHKLHPSRFK